MYLTPTHTSKHTSTHTHTHKDSSTYMTGLDHIYYTTQSYERHDSFILVTSLTHMCDMILLTLGT